MGIKKKEETRIVYYRYLEIWVLNVHTMRLNFMQREKKNKKKNLRNRNGFLIHNSKIFEA